MRPNSARNICDTAAISRRGALALGSSALAALFAVPANVRATPQSADEVLEQGMARWKVPGVGYAIVRPGEIVTGSLGLRRAGAHDRIAADTLFQAASLSKSIAAVCALVLVERGTLALDTDVHAYLKSWTLPVPSFAKDRPVTLRRLLAMTAGINVPGYLGYRPGLPLPDLRQILDGAPPANSQAVRIVAPPGTAEVYSGGGYEIAQAVIQDATGQGFAAVARDAVIAPSGMTLSAFEQPLPPQRAGNAAAGHTLDGRTMAGGGNVLPELAAAGLWSTPGDLAKFLVALSKSRHGRARALLDPATIGQMLTPVDGFHYALGGPVRGAGRDLVFMKRGHNVGYHSYMLLFPETGQGAVIMTNSENGDRLIEPFLRHVSAREGWPHWGALAE
jgi:CubicO group peptidase (beta-lactamase class C family)